ncbi:zf-CCHC domain-containing protein [Tanacetum coccineum]
MNTNFNNDNEPWELSLDIDDSDLHLTPVMHPSSSTRFEPSPSTPNTVRIIPAPVCTVQPDTPIGYCPNPVRIIPGPAGIVQQAKLLKEKDDDFKSGSWVSATNYVNANGGNVTGCLGDIKNFLKKGKLDQVIAIVKSCSLNVLGDLTVTMKDLSGTVPRTVHHKVIGEGGYRKDITVGAALILHNVLVFSLNPSMHYLNITKKRG